MREEQNIKSRMTRWKKALSPHMRPAPSLDSERAALLIIDPQVHFSEMLAPVAPCLLRVLDQFRKRELPVVFTRHRHVDPLVDGGMMAEWWDDLLIDGEPEAELVSELRPEAGELLIEKCRYSAFLNTSLEEDLKRRGVRDLVIGGVMTNLCCETTARDAYMRDFRVFFLIDGTGTCSEEYQIASLKNLAYGFAYLVKCSDILAAVK